LEASVEIDCQVHQPGNPTPLWQGTVKGRADESEITQDMGLKWEQRKSWVVRKALDSALQEFVTTSDIRSISVRLRGEAYAKAVKASQEAEAGGKIPQAVKLYAKAYSLADTEDRALTTIKAIARLTRSEPDKTLLPEEARRFGIQATSLAEKKRYDEAIVLYDQALEFAPWWAEGHYNRALIAANQNRYRDAVTSMKLFLTIAPNSPDARAAQDKIYEWELEKK
jgi:tetratricopeptide (TPR) repeat protein